MKPVVFLSHSSQDLARATALNQALTAGGLLSTTFDASDLRTGEEWRPQLYRWMAGCHGGVLLLTEQVMAKPEWVLQEATILRARSVIEGPAFRLFLLIDEAVFEHSGWKQLFHPLELDLLQAVILPDPAASTAEFAAKVQAGMQELTRFSDDHQGRLAAMVFDCLAPFLAEATASRLLAERLGITDAWWQGIAGPPHALRSLLARRLAAGELREFGKLDSLFKALQGKATREARMLLLRALRSHWVPLENAERLGANIDALHPPAAGATPQNILLLRTECSAAQTVAELHAERRYLPWDTGSDWLPVPPGNETAGALHQTLRVLLQDLICGGDSGVDDDLLVELIDDRRQRGIYTCVHIGAAVSAAHVLPVALAFWPCLFVLTAREPACGHLASELGLTALQPRDAATEKLLLYAGFTADRYANSI